MTAADNPGTSGARFASFREFYPFYLGEHRNRISRRLHVIGTLLAMAILVAALASSRWRLLLAVPVADYALAWIGDYCFEGNSPVNLRPPLYNLSGDLTMVRDGRTGRLRW